VGDTQSVSRDDIVVCACGNNEYKARDAIDAAFFRGELELSWKAFLRRVSAEKRAEELDLQLDDDAVNGAAETFRYNHDLITAEEMEQWLSARWLTLDDFSDYLARQHWDQIVGEEVEPENTDLTSAASELRELFIVELLFSGELDRLTTRLIWRLAAHAANATENPEPITTARHRFFDRDRVTAAQVTDQLNRLARDQQWFDEIAALEAAYSQRCQALLNARERKKELDMLRIPLTQFEAEVIEFESADAAKEALFCIREDGLSMEEVAAEGRYPYRQISFLQENVPNELEQKFLSAAFGDLLGPLARGDGFELYRIIKRDEPRPDDPTVQQRIDQRLIERHFSALAGKYVEARLPAFFSAE
jgi:hypothetical protein